MCTIGEFVRHKQPDVYNKLRKKKEVAKIAKSKGVEISTREVERLMRHDGYERVRGALRQTRRG